MLILHTSLKKLVTAYQSFSSEHLGEVRVDSGGQELTSVISRIACKTYFGTENSIALFALFSMDMTATSYSTLVPILRESH